MAEDEQLKQVTLRQQPFSAAEKLHDIVAETYKQLKKTIPSVQRSMALYLANRDTEVILFKPIKVKVQERFQQLLQILADHYTEEDRQIVACPRLEQINLLLSSKPRRSSTSTT